MRAIKYRVLKARDRIYYKIGSYLINKIWLKHDYLESVTCRNGFKSKPEQARKYWCIYSEPCEIHECTYSTGGLFEL